MLTCYTGGSLKGKQHEQVFFRHGVRKWQLRSLGGMLSRCLWSDHGVLYALDRTSALCPFPSYRGNPDRRTGGAQIYKVQDFEMGKRVRTVGRGSFINLILIVDHCERHSNAQATALPIYRARGKIIRPCIAAETVLVKKKVCDNVQK